MKRRPIILKSLLGLTALLLLGVLIVVSGVFPVMASFGHLPGVAWLLDFASGRSIATYSLPVDVPDLDDPQLVALGALAYHSNCHWCHGSPLEPQPVVASRMLPAPPYLPPSLAQWKSRELFTIVKHGIKFAGMPAWPTQDRDEEVWAVVAFLRAFPAMDEATYTQLVFPTAADRSMTSDADGLPSWMRCDACHGSSNTPPVANWVPTLHGQSLTYLQEAMRAYRTGTRPSGIMQPIAARVTERQMETLLQQYETTESNSTPLGANPESSDGDLGHALAHQGDAAAKIPACNRCHTPSRGTQRPEYPLLAGLDADYLLRQLDLFASGVRQGPRAAIMREIAENMSPEQRRAAAAYYHSHSSTR